MFQARQAQLVECELNTMANGGGWQNGMEGRATSREKRDRMRPRGSTKIKNVPETSFPGGK